MMYEALLFAYIMFGLGVLILGVFILGINWAIGMRQSLTGLDQSNQTKPNWRLILRSYKR